MLCFLSSQVSKRWGQNILLPKLYPHLQNRGAIPFTKSVNVQVKNAKKNNGCAMIEASE